MEQQVQDAGIADSVEFVGRQSQEVLPQYYDRIDILLMPSRSEGFGLTAIEGMARGCVVVASRTGGLPEVVKEGEVGLLHDTENIDDIAEKVCRLLNNPELGKQLSSITVTYIHRFSFECFNRLFNNLYQKMA